MNKSLKFIIFLALFFAVIHPASSQDSSLSPSLWMGGKKTILAINPQNGTTQITIPNLETTRDVAVDSRRGVVWAVGDEKFYAFHTDGMPIFSRFFPATAGDMDDDADDDDSGKSEDESLAFHRRPQLIIARHGRNQMEKQAFHLLIRYVGVERLNNEAKRGTPWRLFIEARQGSHRNALLDLTDWCSGELFVLWPARRECVPTFPRRGCC